MHADEFIKILASFADSTKEVDSDKSVIVANIRDELIEIKLKQQGFDLFVEEFDTKTLAEQWITNRLAHLPQLASRIIDYIPKEEYFVPPNGILLDDIVKNPDETFRDTQDVIKSIINTIDTKNALSSHVIYLTSDAGEGKTTLINRLAHAQAEAYKKKESHWLLVPIPLGGRPFLRFDDVIIASLVNRYRFTRYYYESFIELVKLGVIVPALDGFEEMFMESSSGEALSALGGLMNTLSSKGTVIIAARKAYFDYKSFAVQAKLFDSIESDFVTFSRISIARWDDTKFIAYARKRNIQNPELSYQMLSSALQSNHPILTRAVLVKQLLDVFQTTKDFEDLIHKIIAGTAEGYFANFVNAILEREANTKWIDKSGEPPQPLLTVDQHSELLSQIAQEMWTNNTDLISLDILDFITDLFADSNKLTPAEHRQVKERVKQHALLVLTNHPNSISFDHEEFKQYFLGVAIAKDINNNDMTSLVLSLRVSAIAQQTLETVNQILKKLDFQISKAEQLLIDLCKREGTVSYLRENLGAIFIRLLAGTKQSIGVVTGLNLPIDSLASSHLSGIHFKNCYFQGTSLEHLVINKCKFEDCKFDRIELYASTNVSNTELIDCEISCVYDEKYDNCFYDPQHIIDRLKYGGFKLSITDPSYRKLGKKVEIDEKLILTERVLRRFLKSTQLNINIFKVKLGKSFKVFESLVLPALLSNKIFVEVPYTGGGPQRRFKLGKRMSLLEQALEKSNGQFEKFIEIASSL